MKEEETKGKNIAKERRVIPDPIDDRKYQKMKENSCELSKNI